MLEDFKLKVFKTVAEELSFSKAARRLGVSQPAVSQNISELEKMFGVRLFEREPDIRLTPQGIAFKEYAEKILYWCDSAETFFGLNGKITTKSLNIKASKEVADYLLPQALAAVGAAVPHLVTRVVSESNQIPNIPFTPDVEIVSSFEKPDLGNSSFLIGTLPIAVVASCTNADAHRSDASLSYFRMPVAIWESLVPMVSISIRSRIIFCSTSLESIKKFIISSPTCAAILPLPSVLPELREKAFVRMPLKEPVSGMSVYYRPSTAFSATRLNEVLRASLSDFLEGLE